MKIKFTAKGYEPFLPQGIIRRVVEFYRKQPIIVDCGGVQIRLNRQAHYQIIK